MINFLQKLSDVKERVFRKIVKNFPNWISPNFLTILRAFLAIPIVFLLLNERYLFAALILVPAFLLDWLDGPLARVKNRVSFFGQLADPVADKLLFLPIFLIIGLEILPHYLVYLVLSLELALIILVFVLRGLERIIKVKFKAGSNIFGQYKFAFQIIGLFLLFLALSLDSLLPYSIIIFLVAACLATLSIIKHCLTFDRLVK